MSLCSTSLIQCIVRHCHHLPCTVTQVHAFSILTAISSHWEECNVFLHAIHNSSFLTLCISREEAGRYSAGAVGSEEGCLGLYASFTSTKLWRFEQVSEHFNTSVSSFIKRGWWCYLLRLFESFPTYREA